jgi:hypothetical protein
MRPRAREGLSPRTRRAVSTRRSCLSLRFPRRGVCERDARRGGSRGSGRSHEVASVTPTEFRQPGRTMCATIYVHTGGVDQTSQPEVSRCPPSHPGRSNRGERAKTASRRPSSEVPSSRGSRAVAVVAGCSGESASQPHTSYATSTMSRSFATSSSYVSTLPSTVDEKPHCGERQS